MKSNWHIFLQNTLLTAHLYSLQDNSIRIYQTTFPLTSVHQSLILICILGFPPQQWNYITLLSVVQLFWATTDSLTCFFLINCNGFGKECIFCIAKCPFWSPEHSLEMNSCVCLHTFLPQTKTTETPITDYIHICWSEIYSSYHAAVSRLSLTSYLATMKITRSDNLYWSDTQSVD